VFAVGSPEALEELRQLRSDLKRGPADRARYAALGALTVEVEPTGGNDVVPLRIGTAS
jgi:hypothetical protein